MKERLNELNEKYEIDPEVLKATLAFLDCGDHPAMPPVHHNGFRYQHAMKVLFGIKTDEDWNCALEEPINWDVKVASPMEVSEYKSWFSAKCGHLIFTLKGERKISIGMQLNLSTPYDFKIESWPYGDLTGCMEANRYFKVNEKTKTDVFDFLKKLETHECHEYCNSEKFPYDEEE